MSKFQIIVIAIFVVCIIAGVTLFATYKGREASSSLPAITVWGTFPQSVFSSFLQELNNTRSTQLSVNYVEKSGATFDKDFIETLARGQGPDAILISQDMMLRHADKIIPIPNDVLTERDFLNSYIPQAGLYINSSGVMAVPFAIDPLVMYWNKDIFTNAGVAKYPSFWEEFTNLIEKVNIRDANSNIRRSAIAMGEFNNINHAREILGTLLLQAGNPVTKIGDAGVEATLGNGSFSGTDSSTPAINFFTQFANPQNPQYSWNRSLPNSKNFFLAGSLATYFGFASEIFDLRTKNPNIDFDVSPLPQASNGRNRITYGSMYGLSIVRSAPNPSGTYSVISSLTAPDALALLNKISYLPPVRRDMLALGSTDPYQAIFYDSALISRGWLDAGPTKTNTIFQNMVESITSGRETTYNAIQLAQEEMDLALQNP
jgi:ABC-type glycerol-3-phosphate transport system substrate-binding protein